MMWQIGRESSSFFGAGAALLLQTAHPWIAQAVADHSTALADPLGRFHRTFRPVFAMIYGTRAQALAQARRVYAVHSRIRGTLPQTLGRFEKSSPYTALDPDALFWVYATLWHTAIAVRERMMGPLGVIEKDLYNEDMKRFAALFAIPKNRLQPDWAGFEARFHDIANSGMLVLGEAGYSIGAHFLKPGRARFGRLVPDWYRRVTASLLPPRLADAYGLPTDIDVDRLWQRLAGAYRRLPAHLRLIGPYQEAEARLAGRNPGLWIATLNRFWLGRPRLEPAA